MLARRVYGVVAAFSCALAAVPTEIIRAEDGVWVNVTDEIAGRYQGDSPSGSYDPCRSQTPHTETSVREVVGTTRDDETQVEQAREVTYDLVGEDAIVIGSVSATDGANILAVDLVAAVEANPSDIHAVLALEMAGDVAFRAKEDAFFASYEPLEQKYEVYCVLPVGYVDPVDEDGVLIGEPAEGEVLFDEFWVPIVSEEVVEFELMVMISQYLAPPETDFMMRNPDHGWLTVKVPTELMVENVQPVTLFASVTNRTGSVSASITATPEGLIFDAGETGEDGQSGGVACSWAELESMSCMYEYYNSSSIESDKAFDTQSTVLWRVATSAAAPVDMATTSSMEVQVAEVQAIGTG